ncbi:MAG: sigma-70 family RNA polymerase sigma factor [Planctomycetota bacterium]|nr:sigma-70 family RNA polymerase sigma factor [Planctomycetota bacterium]
MPFDFSYSGPEDRGKDSGAWQTDWSMIFRAVHGDEAPAAEAWDQLARRYWPAIYAYIRSSGRDIHQASDLTQAFVCDVMVRRQLLESADPTRGRFRTLLMTALKNYLVEQHRFATRRKRLPRDGRLLELDREGGPALQIPAEATPETAFSAQWGATLVRRVLEQVRAECQAQELGTHWQVFEARVVSPMMLGGAPEDYGLLVRRLGLRDAAQASNMMVTVKRRFARALFEAVSGTVGSPDEVDDELRALRRALERPG